MASLPEQGSHLKSPLALPGNTNSAAGKARDSKVQ
jgi:hypothetical protein